MPDVVTPVTLSWTGGALNESPAVDFVSASRFKWSGASIIDGPGTNLSTTTAVPELDRLTRFEPLVDDQGHPTIRFMAIWQEFAEQIEAAFRNQQNQITDLSAILARLVAAENLATAANDTATSTRNAQDLADSYTDPTSVVSFTDSGTANIIAHKRRYPISSSSVDVNSGSVTGLTAGSYVTIFYNDAGRAGGDVSYQATTNAVSQQDGVHIVGSGTVPAAGEPPSEGASPSAPGYRPPPAGGAEY